MSLPAFDDFFNNTKDKVGGFVNIPLKKHIIAGENKYATSKALDILFALACFYTKNNMITPSKSRIAILSGYGEDTVAIAYNELVRLGLAITTPDGRIRYKQAKPNADFSENVDFYKNIVFRGIWPHIMPSSRKLYRFMLAKSRPGDCLYENRYEQEDSFHDIASSNRCPEGNSHVWLGDMTISELDDALKLPKSTRNDAIKQLEHEGLIINDLEQEVYILPHSFEAMHRDVIEREYKFICESQKRIRTPSMNRQIAANNRKLNKSTKDP